MPQKNCPTMAMKIITFAMFPATDSRKISSGAGMSPFPSRLAAPCSKVPFGIACKMATLRTQAAITEM